MLVANRHENSVRRNLNSGRKFIYFASYVNSETKDYMMTPEDYVRSISFNWILDASRYNFSQLFSRLEASTHVCTTKDKENPVLMRFTEAGLIKYPMYLLLHTLVTTPMVDLEVGFRVIDDDDDGYLSWHDLSQYLETIFTKSQFGSLRAEKYYFKSNVVQLETATMVFENDEKGFEIGRLLDTCLRLKKEVMRTGFDRFEQVDGRISEEDFAGLILSFSKSLHSTNEKVRKRVRTAFSMSDDHSVGMTFDDLFAFYNIALSLPKIEAAFAFAGVLEKPINKNMLKVITHNIVGIQLSDHLVDVVFEIFDANGDKRLKGRDFVTALKERVV